LHLIKPLGFFTDDKHLKRAGLDYWQAVDLYYHDNLTEFLATISKSGELHLVTKFANATYANVDYNGHKDHYFLFGKETTGLPEKFMRENSEKCVRLPMNDQHVRSLNLANSVAIVLYEALRQQDFPDLELTHHYDDDKLD
jgi:tRNA (cytidine/uridine-2'-O-)-methyltransferase